MNVIIVQETQWGNEITNQNDIAQVVADYATGEKFDRADSNIASSQKWTAHYVGDQVVVRDAIRRGKFIAVDVELKIIAQPPQHTGNCWGKNGTSVFRG